MGRLAGFPGHSRLRRPADFERVFKQGTRLSGPLFNAVILDNDLEGARLGLAVSRRVSPKAVTRNSIKRHVRESFRARYAALPAVDIVILARAACVQADGAAIRAGLDRLWERIYRQCGTS